VSFLIATSGLQMQPAPVVAGLLYQEDFTGVPVGSVTLNSSWLAKGYSEIEANVPADLQVLARANMPAGLLADPNFPAAKSRICAFNLTALENQTRLLWSGFPASIFRTVSFSWWEYRLNANFGGEKFCRVGNFIAGPGSNRGIDAIVGIDASTRALTLFSNSLNMHGFPDQALGTLGAWPPGLRFFEVVHNLPVDTSATGSCQMYIGNTLVGSASGLQYYDTAGQAAVGLQLWDMGGWASGSGVFPIPRHYCAARIATQRQGQWAMNAV
jgi:hypothetical protein